MAAPQYNVAQYDVNQYDAETTAWSRTLTDATTPIDTETVSDSVVEIESSVLMIALVNLAINGRFETVSASDADTPSMLTYNSFMYNMRMYNAHYSFGLAKNIQPVKLDTVVIFETASTLVSFVRSFPETLLLTDARMSISTVQKLEAVISSDVLTKQITNKGLTVTIKMNDWFTIKNSPQSDPWS